MEEKLAALAPANGPNAIVNAAFAIELTQQADSRFLAGFLALAAQMAKDGFEPPIPQQMVTMSIGPGAGSVGTQEINGYTYLKKGPAGQQRQDFSLRGNAISVVTYDYSRWHSVWDEVRILFERSAPLVAISSAAIKSIAMQYLDKFTWRVSGAAFPVRNVLQASARYFATYGLEQSGPWHNQIGYQLSEPESSWAVHRLDNINISVAVEAGFPTLNILTIYRYFARSAVKESPDFVKSILPPFFERVHDDNKALLREVLMPEVCNLIKLND